MVTLILTKRVYKLEITKVCRSIIKINIGILKFCLRLHNIKYFDAKFPNIKLFEIDVSTFMHWHDFRSLYIFLKIEFAEQKSDVLQEIF